VALIGTAPGFHEFRTGRPFTGPGSEPLWDLLEELGLGRGTIYYTNLVKCDGLPQALHVCPERLDDELAGIPVLVPMGNEAVSRYFPGLKVSQASGKARRLPSGQIAVASYHPAAVARSPELVHKLREAFQTVIMILEEARR
jgi:DNA polymerase